MSLSAQDLLDQTNAAISACLAAQDYSIAGRQKRMAELAALTDFRRTLIDEINAAGGPMCELGHQDHPSL